MSSRPAPNPMYGSEIWARPLCLVGEICNDHVVAAIAVQVSFRDAHSGPRLAVRSVGEPARKTLFVEYPVARLGWVARRTNPPWFTNPKMIGRSVVGNHETRIPVGAEISGQYAEAGSLFRVQADLRRHNSCVTLPSNGCGPQ